MQKEIEKAAQYGWEVAEVSDVSRKASLGRVIMIGVQGLKKQDKVTVRFIRKPAGRDTQ
jgi:hypothetical protein